MQGHNGLIKVKVTVAEEKITTIEVLEQTETEVIYNSAEQPVIQSIIETNSLTVDTITGATKSSEGIIKAVQEALKEAK